MSRAEMSHEIALGIWRTFPPILLVLGTIGNFVTIIVMTQRKNRHSSIAKYLTTLALSDLTVLWMGIPRNWLNNGYGIDIRSFSEIICKVHLFLLFWGSNTSTAMVVTVTIERFISTWLPTNVKGICTARNVNIIIFSIVTSLVLYNSHFLYGMTHTEFANGTNNAMGVNCYPRDEQYAYFLFNIWTKLNFVVFSATPLVVLLILNTAIIIRVLQLRRNNPARNAKSYQVTAMLIIVNVAYMVCVTPLLGFLILYSDWALSQGVDQSDAVLELVLAIFSVLFYTNNAVNFILYFLSGSAFRKEAKKLLCQVFICCPTIRRCLRIRVNDINA